MSDLHPIQHRYRFRSPYHLLDYKILLQLWFTNEASKVAAFGDHAHPHPHEFHILPLNFTWGDNQDALCQLQELSARRYTH